MDSALLEQVSSEADAKIRAAQIEESKAKEAHAACKRATETAKQEVAVARQELEVAEAAVKKAELSAKAAENSSEADIERARAHVADAKSLPAAAKSRIKLREALVDHAEVRQTLASRKSGLWAAKVELEKARGVRALDRPESRDIDIESYENAVRGAQEDFDGARVDLDSSTRKVQTARVSYDERVRAIPASYRTLWNEDSAVRDREAELLEQALLR
jgi:hypothetical protein